GNPDGPAIATTTTNANGLYEFENLLPGSYVVGVPTPPTAYQLSSGPTNTTDNVDNVDGGIQDAAGDPTYSGTIILTAGSEPTTDEDGNTGDTQDDDNPVEDAYGDQTVDFGFTPAVSIGSTVFLDENNNGIQDNNEQGIPGVLINLYDENDNFIASTTTNSNGDYYFGGLFEGNYYLEIPGDQFGAGMSLADSPLSSVPTDTNDNQEDFDDNGDQTGGQGTTVTSPLITLMAGSEPTEGDEDGQGGTQDDAYDANGDMTVDFGFVPIRFDLALIKKLADGQSMSVEPGDTIYYTITVINQGNLAADNITVTDYVPADMMFDPTIAVNAMYGWSGSASGPVSTTIINFMNGDSLGIGETMSIDLALVVNSPLLPPGASLINAAEISSATDEFNYPQDDVDSTPNNNPDDDTFLVDNEINGNGLQGGDEDDHDPAEVIIQGYDLALIKLLADDQPADVRPGDTIHYVIRVINQGMIAADSILVTDYIPSEMAFEPGVTGNEDWTVNGANVERRISVLGGELPSGGLVPGDSVEVSLYLTLDNPLAAGTVVANYAEITEGYDENGNPQDDYDSTPDNINNDTYTNNNDVSGNGNDGEDEDDHDAEFIAVQSFDLALIKELAAGQSINVEPGDTVHYTITVINQGMIAADNIVVQDNVPGAMVYEGGITGNDDEGWSEVSPGVVQRTINAGDEMGTALQPGESV
ncbi:MAG: DUF11 domain-containing protein, partial [Lewinella sp.]|nr:DUF11 domain-containing protein [Lewinella sp.]